MRVLAVAETRRNRPVLSHWSAAAVHGLPIVGNWPAQVHTIIGKLVKGRSRNGVVKHALALDDGDIVEVEGMLVTTVARTILDIAAMGSFMTAVVMADHAIHVDRFDREPPLTTKAELRELWGRSLPFRAFARALEVIDFADTRADSPLESVSRVNMRVIGCPQPQLQVEFRDWRGVIGETDFYWRQFNLVGETDGDVKYLDPRYRAGRTADQVVLDEKVREDRLRAIGQRVSRWRWDVGLHPGLLRSHLVAAGLPMDSQRRFR